MPLYVVCGYALMHIGRLSLYMDISLRYNLTKQPVYFRLYNNHDTNYTDNFKIIASNDGKITVIIPKCIAFSRMNYKWMDTYIYIPTFISYLYPSVSLLLLLSLTQTDTCIRINIWYINDSTI